jgi:hypothetical protein
VLYLIFEFFGFPNMATPKDRDEDVTGSRDYRKEDNILIY